MSNETDTTPIAPFEYRLGCAIIYSIVSILGLSAHFFIIFLFVRRRKSLLKMAFYMLALQMCICDSILLLVQLLIAIPLTWAADNVYLSWNAMFIYTGGAFSETVFFNSLTWMALWMAINRLTVFSSNRLNSIFFDKKPLICLILFTYVFCLTEVTCRQIFGCTKEFSTKGFYFYFDCVAPIGQTMMQATIIKDMVVPITMFIIYVGLFFYLKAYLAMVDKNSEYTKGKGMSEYKLLIQGGIVCGVLELEICAFDFFTKIPVSGMGVHYMTFVINMITLLNNCVSPIIYFTFNKDIQSYALETFNLKKVKTITLTKTVSTSGVLSNTLSPSQNRFSI